MISNIVQSIQGLNIFGGIDFSVLYSWLPSDIGATCAVIIAISIILWVFGLIKRVLPL